MNSEVEMICFEVWVNGKKICLAGVGEDGILNAILDGEENNGSQTFTLEV